MLSGKWFLSSHSRKLRSHYVYNLIAVCLLVFLFSSCGDDEKALKDPQDQFNLNNADFVLSQAKNVLGEDVKYAFPGEFNEDTITEVSAGTEIENKDVWGIKFYLLKQSGNKLIKDYETELLEGSFTKSLIKKIKLPAYNYDLVYYNSQDYFLGSGGGEIFSYLIDYKNKEKFYAHLFNEPGDPISLYLSTNIKSTEVKNFFINNFKKDYPALSIVKKDVDLKY